MGKGSIIGMGTIWAHRGYRVHYGYVFYHGRMCNPLNLVSANRTIDKVHSNPRTNGLFLTYVRQKYLWRGQLRVEDLMIGEVDSLVVVLQVVLRMRHRGLRIGHRRHTEQRK